MVLLALELAGNATVIVAWGGGEGEHEARPEGDRSEKFGETAVGNGVIMGVGTCTGTSETTTAGFKVNLSWGGLCIH
jgi:hypothetical protein